MSYICEQYKVLIKGKQRGNYPITTDILKKCGLAISNIQSGECNIFLLHTSASISLNNFVDSKFQQKNADFYKKFQPYTKDIQHNYAGEDDMAAHGLCNMMGVSLNLTIKDGKLLLGKYQGIYLNEFRNFGDDRKIIVTIQGTSF